MTGCPGHESMLCAKNATEQHGSKAELPIEKIVARLSGRRTCPQCKTIFHVETRPSRAAGVCDQCGTALFQREDDHPESIRVRMLAYQRSTAPLASYYRQRGLLISISAE